MIIPNIWENKKCSKPPTRHGIVWKCGIAQKSMKFSASWSCFQMAICGIYSIFRQTHMSIDFHEPQRRCGKPDGGTISLSLQVIDMWWFPEMGVPPNHPHFNGFFSWFSIINQPFWIPPCLWKPPCFKMPSASHLGVQSFPRHNQIMDWQRTAHQKGES